MPSTACAGSVRAKRLEKASEVGENFDQAPREDGPRVRSPGKTFAPLPPGCHRACPVCRPSRRKQRKQQRTGCLSIDESSGPANVCRPIWAWSLPRELTIGAKGFCPRPRLEQVGRSLEKLSRVLWG